MAGDLERELLTAEDFPEWLTPGGQADPLNFVDWLLGAYVDEHDLGLLYRRVVSGAERRRI